MFGVFAMFQCVWCVCINVWLLIVLGMSFRIWRVTSWFKVSRRVGYVNAKMCGHSRRSMSCFVCEMYEQSLHSLQMYGHSLRSFMSDVYV